MIPSVPSLVAVMLMQSTTLLAGRGSKQRMGVRARADSQKGRGTFESDEPSVLTLVRRTDGRVRFLVGDDLEAVDNDIAAYGDEPVIRGTDQCSISDGIDEYDEIDGHLAITHDDHYVVGDAHTDSCENRYSFLRNWV